MTAADAGISAVLARNSLPEVRLGGDDTRVEVRVYNSQVEDFDGVKRQLMSDGFWFRAGTAKYWWRLLDETQFQTSQLLAASWAQHPGIRFEAWQDGRRVLDHRVPGGRPVWPAF